MRPQIIMIAGASLLLRTFVNASIRLASIFIKQKMLQFCHRGGCQGYGADEKRASVHWWGGRWH